MIIRVVLSIKLPIGSFLEQAMQGKYVLDLTHCTAQGRLHIDLQRHIYIYIYIYIIYIYIYINILYI